MQKSKISLFGYLFIIFLLISCDLNYSTLKIIAFSPANRATGIQFDVFIEISFNETVNRTDVENSFSLKNSDGRIDGVYTWITPSMFRYTPVSPLKGNGRYTVELPRTIRDEHGNIMDSDFISEFYVGNDFTAAEIVFSNPSSGTGAVSGIPLNQTISVFFSKRMNRESVERNFSITPDVAGYYTWFETTQGVPESRLVFTPTGKMEYGKLYSFTISGTAEDYSGNSLGTEYRVNFITGDDRTPPELLSFYEYRYPEQAWGITGINHVSRSDCPCIIFSEPMDRQSVEKAFSIIPAVQGIFEWDSDNTVIFRPLNFLAPETRYQVAVETSARDLSGHKLISRCSVELITDKPDSLYIKCGGVRGSNHDGEYVFLPDSWPRLIDMGSGSPVNQCYFILLEFLSNESEMIPAKMDKYSIFDNIIIDTFKGTSGGELPGSAYIAAIEWRGESTALIKIGGMTNKSSGQMPALYRLIIAGGNNGSETIKAII
jgi:hypothetical protein